MGLEGSLLLANMKAEENLLFLTTRETPLYPTDCDFAMIKGCTIYVPICGPEEIYEQLGGLQFLNVAVQTFPF